MVSSHRIGIAPAKQLAILASIGAGAVILSILSYSYFRFTSSEITKLVTANLQEDTEWKAIIWQTW
ncbi:hypothetical protein [Candidatus Nitrososphaera gargensis]|uniref:hypothetical protein n=1 Tax=Candidatus Nitrososphaera gargensis TaxID=497727 RepID=UPI0011E509B4|nr:hypothetical protein [Candidatus Nitrososphaera gargensis]